VELFTSQGCSSCPPADTLLGELASRSDVLALAFHVDYWDELGWRDRFELPQAAQRQSQYASRLGRSSVYTPQLVIDGREDLPGAGRAALARVLAAPRRGVPLHITVQGGDIAIELEAAPGSGTEPGSGGSEVLLVSYLPEAVTAIGRGENSGRTLREFNIVRSIATLGSWQGKAASWHVRRGSLPADAAFVAVLVQEPQTGFIVAAQRQALAP
jgi:hypothetical protein